MIAIIADDLTGATELAALGHRHGLAAVVTTKAPSAAAVEILAVDTDSRLLSPAAAAQRVGSLAADLNRLRPGWIYKKTDSVLRGNLAAELAALMTALGFPRALLVPANPALGRTVRAGRYWVGGVPLDETDFRHDPQHPRYSSRVLDLVAATPDCPVVSRRPDEPLPARGIVVGDAESAADLDLWAGRVDGQTLPAGAAQFFAALLRHRAGEAAPKPKATSLPDLPEVFVCGSLSSTTHHFVADCLRQGVPVIRLPAEAARPEPLLEALMRQLAHAATEALAAHPRLVLTVGLPPVADPAIARSLAVTLARVAALLLQSLPQAHLFAEGGATAAACMRALGWESLHIQRELAQGVVTSIPEAAPAHRFTVKPGSYRWPVEVAGAASE